MKILICDENIDSQTHLTNHLTTLGHKCILAANQTEALDAFKLHEPDLVIIDYELPNTGGIDTARKLNESCYDFSQWIPIIIMSNDSSDSRVVDALNSGADDFWTKPISAELLKAKINSIRRIVSLRENLIDFGNQLRDVNEKLLTSNQLLSELSLRDPLTLLANRRAFEESIERACRLARRNKSPMSLIMIDVDHFKAYNDTYGHQAGDFCLKQVAQSIKSSLHRDKDVAARYGGEEFSVILPETTKYEALKIAECIRKAVEVIQIKNVGAPRGYVSVSLGVATSEPGVEFVSESLVAAGDAALYEAKENGRNRVVESSLPINNEKARRVSSYKTGSIRPDQPQVD